MIRGVINYYDWFTNLIVILFVNRLSIRVHVYRVVYIVILVGRVMVERKWFAEEVS